jgi:hypothetical protein
MKGSDSVFAMKKLKKAKMIEKDQVYDDIGRRLIFC